MPRLRRPWGAAAAAGLGDCDAVPVLEGPRIIGIVTQTDMIAAFARESLRHPAA